MSRIAEQPVLRSFSYVKQSRNFFTFFRNSDRLTGTFHHRRSRLLKTGFFRQVRELKIQKKNPGSALRIGNVPHL
jgi:hypothetical protein